VAQVSRSGGFYYCSRDIVPLEAAESLKKQCWDRW